MTILRFIISRKFFINLAIILGIIFLMGILTLYGLDFYTRHGEAIAVPDFTELTFAEAKRIADSKDLILLVSDSVHIDDKYPGVIIAQYPVADHKVKAGRTIYLTINGLNPAMIAMPDLTGISVRQASSDAELFGLKIGKLTYVPDLSTTVIKQKINGKEIEPGSMVPPNSVVDLVVGKGNNKEKTSVPNILGLSFKEAESKLTEASLNIGISTYDGSVKTSGDSTSAKIWKQHPRPSKEGEVPFGSYIDIWLTIDSDIIPQPEKENDEENPANLD